MIRFIVGVIAGITAAEIARSLGACMVDQVLISGVVAGVVAFAL